MAALSTSESAVPSKISSSGFFPFLDFSVMADRVRFLAGVLLAV